MSAVTDRLKSIKDRVLRPGSADDREAKLQRARKKAAAEAQRREHQREDMHGKIHRK
jgi:hypothetical protein